MPCPILLVLISNFKDAFQIPSSELTLDPNDTTSITVSFNPSMEGRCTGTLYIIANGGQVEKVQLFGTGGSALNVLEEKLDFGPVDIYFAGSRRNLNLINHDQLRSLPINFTSSTSELIVNSNQPVVLGPGEIRKVPIEFLPSWNGMRNEYLKISAPNSDQFGLVAVTFVGPELLVPVVEDIFLPPGLVTQSTYVRIPLNNISEAQIVFTVSSPHGSPIKLQLLDGNLTNSSLAIAAIQSKVYSTAAMSGIVIILAPRATALLEVGTLATSVGVFRTPLHIELTKPRKAEISVLYLNATIFDDDYLAIPNTVQLLKNFFKYPYAIPESSLAGGNAGTPSGALFVDGASHSFRFVNSLCTIYGANAGFKSQVPNQYVSLLNVSGTVAAYQLVISTPFKTDVPLTGTIPGSSSLLIPLWFDTDAYYFSQETSNYMVLGSICALDTNPSVRPGMTVCQLHGYVQELMCLEMRKGRELITFPSSEVVEKTKRFISIRNKSHLPLNWYGEMASKGQNGRPSASPFLLSEEIASLKPFQYFCIEVEFESPTPGDYQFVLPMKYNIASESQLYRNLPNVILECKTSAAKVILDQSAISLGCVQVGDECSAALLLQNSSLPSALVHFAQPTALLMSKSLISIHGKASEIISLKFQPTEFGPWQQYLEFVIGRRNIAIPIIANVGFMMLESNLVKFCKLPIDQMGIVPADITNLIDLSKVATSSYREEIMIIRNSGSLPISITEIKVNSQFVTCRLASEKSRKAEPAQKPSLDREYYNQMETDWDLPTTDESAVDLKRKINLTLWPGQSQNVAFYIYSKKQVILFQKGFVLQFCKYHLRDWL